MRPEAAVQAYARLAASGSTRTGVVSLNYRRRFSVFLGRSDARCQGEPSPSMDPRWGGLGGGGGAV